MGKHLVNILIFLALIPLGVILGGNLFLYLNNTLGIGPLFEMGSFGLGALALGAVFSQFSVFTVIATVIATYFLQKKFQWVGSKQYKMLLITYTIIFLTSFTIFFIWLMTNR